MEILAYVFASQEQAQSFLDDVLSEHPFRDTEGNILFGYTHANVQSVVIDDEQIYYVKADGSPAIKRFANKIGKKAETITLPEPEQQEEEE